jgi:hypothetical protein
MARGDAVIRYAGKRGVVWRIKYSDAEGKQVMETVGAERDGMTEKRAGELLADRLSDVRRKGYRKPKPLTFGEWSRTWLAEGAVSAAGHLEPSAPIGAFWTGTSAPTSTR